MKLKWGISIIVLLVVIAPFFIRVYPRPPLVSFNYFLKTLEFVEDSLDSIDADLAGYPPGDFELEKVLNDLRLTDRYLANFESDPEKAMLSDTPRVQFAFHDLYDNPIRIWISRDSFRVYSAGGDGISQSGGCDPDDVWTGEPEKAIKHTHKSYFDAWYEANDRNLWVHLVEQLR
ncbi:hypothetical protein VSU19_03630 [Verrucomicrobiales bacterium BCK34]|nr:hypothetical protein [Verrucomicrobiales bacterium BCK34]